MYIVSLLIQCVLVQLERGMKKQLPFGSMSFITAPLVLPLADLTTLFQAPTKSPRPILPKNHNVSDSRTVSQLVLMFMSTGFADGATCP